MKLLQAFKYELIPNGEQQRQMRRFAGSCRFVFNKALALQKERREAGDKKLSYFELNNLLPTWKRCAESSWLAESPSQTLQQSLKDLERAYANFFEKRADFPHFKKKGQGDSFRYPQGVKLDQANDRLLLPKLGWIRYRNSRDVVGTVKNVTVSSHNGKWYVSIQTERDVEPPAPRGGIVGIDLGITRFATLSDGTFVTPLNSFRRHEKALAKAQRRLSHKSKFSHNWKKAKARVQRIHARIGNSRRDFLHKTTTTISENQAMVCVENLKVRNMTRSATGTVEDPGNRVRQKSGLNRSILDQGWFEFRRQLDYKLAWAGGHLIVVPPQNTSRTCPACGHVAKENRLTQAQFACVECSYENHADVVGAINILARGMEKLRDEGQDTVDASIGRETAARIACEVNGAVRPSAAGTRRSDLTA